ncbi:MAG TPA: ubiquinol-cytochrome c reductase iron-sulfur subunit [Gemmataceae bacterium]|nr:ubiquinol-cytochrome c reductase iron-sulfur subunit [Gemmataceae bacterium]
MDRRAFFKWATTGLGAIFGAILGVPAVAYLIDPRNRPAPPSDFRTVARLSELPEGTPHQVVIRDVRQDAWTLHPNDEIGRVWLIKRDAKTVDAFTSICPHLGCSINYEAKNESFLCPCHGGTFDPKGDLVTKPGLKNPAPRGMDRLECEVDGELVRVKYQSFEQGKTEKVLKS